MFAIEIQAATFAIISLVALVSYFSFGAGPGNPPEQEFVPA